MDNAKTIYLAKNTQQDGFWSFYDKLLKEANIAGTPGAGFGTSGQGYFSLTAFGSRESTEEAVERFKTRLDI